ncbi:hypothetical protein [Ruegeria faecimaris]|uniref:hypothetical protein n=1 Tax=Ruegeria faecimaris TaxID=686389 RepID=UPI00248FE244|nr:hypothetical protein [Ruegeria faecimaris]
MSSLIQSVFGRVTQQENGQPVHGILVKIQAVFGDGWRKRDGCKIDLGCVLTAADGRFVLIVDSSKIPEDCRCAGPMELRIKLRDRDGVRIHKARLQIEDCSCTDDIKIDVAIPAKKLACHLSRPLSWAAPNKPFLPESVLDDIEEALELADADRLLRKRTHFFECIRPTLAIFDNSLSDAWSVLNGDVAAKGRYVDVLNALCAKSPTGCGCGDASGDDAGGILQDIFSDDCNDDSCKPIKSKPNPVCCSDHVCPTGKSLISDKDMSLMVFAAMHVSCGHRPTMIKYVGALLEQRCRFQVLTALHEAAVNLICKKPHAGRHFKDLLEYVMCICTGQTPCGQVPCCQTCVRQPILDCITDAYRNWCSIECYTVTKINPERACPGDTVAICGCGFGDIAGQVQFTQHGTMNPGPIAVPTSWSDERICVIVPSSAGCGLAIIPLTQTISVCDRFLDYRKSGTMLAEFEGTSADILKFIVKGHQNDDCLLPGEVLKIRWKVCAADSVTVRIVNTDTGAAIAQISPAPDLGRWDFDQTDFDQTTRVRVEIVVTGKCKPPTVSQGLDLVFQNPPDLSIDGVEVTQAIQYFRANQHLTDPADRGPDNSLQLVANKSAWVRTYLRSGQDPNFDNGQLGNVSGTLQVERRVGGIWSTVANIVPTNAPVTAQDSFSSYDAERRDIDATLNFIIPANVMTGLLRLSITVSSPDDCYGGSGTAQQLVDVDLEQELRVAAVTIGYNGPPMGGGANITLPAPNAAQVAADTSFALRVFPVGSTPNVRIIDSQTTTQGLTNNNFPAGGCDPNWTPILNFVANARTNDGNQGDWLYYGLVNAAIPRSHGNTGCASGGNGAGLSGSPITLAHELGHQAGLPHAPCGTVGTPNASYPLYEPYDTGMTTTDSNGNTVYSDASTGEYGLDTNDGTIHRPANSEDLMGYCGPRWVSIFTHNYMLNRAEFDPVALATGVSGGNSVGAGAMEVDRQDQMRPFVTIVGEVGKDMQVSVASLVRVPTRPLRMSGARTDLVLQLIGDKDEVISSAPVFTMDNHDANGDGCGCGGGDKKDPPKPPYSFIAAMGDVGSGIAIRICQGDAVIWERKRPARPGKLASAEASIGKSGLKVSWKTTGAKRGYDPDIWLQWSSDGERWNGLRVGARGNSVEIDPNTIPVDKVWIRVLAHDGYFTATADTKQVKLPPAPPELAIIHPSEGQVVRPDRPLHLWGTFTGRTEAKSVEWYLDGKKVAKDLDAWIDVPKPGDHVAELRVKGANPVTVKFSTGER